MICDLQFAVFADGVWHTRSTVTINKNNWSGTHQIELPEDASTEDLEEALLALYS